MNNRDSPGKPIAPAEHSFYLRPLLLILEALVIHGETCFPPRADLCFTSRGLETIWGFSRRLTRGRVRLLIQQWGFIFCFHLKTRHPARSTRWKLNKLLEASCCDDAHRDNTILLNNRVKFCFRPAHSELHFLAVIEMNLFSRHQWKFCANDVSRAYFSFFNVWSHIFLHINAGDSSWYVTRAAVKMLIFLAAKYSQNCSNKCTLIHDNIRKWNFKRDFIVFAQNCARSRSLGRKRGI